MFKKVTLCFLILAITLITLGSYSLAQDPTKTPEQNTPAQSTPNSTPPSQVTPSQTTPEKPKSDIVDPANVTPEQKAQDAQTKKETSVPPPVDTTTPKESTEPVVEKPTSTNPEDQPVDQTNVIFPGCSLKVLESKASVSVSQKDKYFSGCIQDIIRFVIVMACLGAVIKIALSGVMQLTPMAGKSTVSSTIQNLIIGLFLLLVGWNIVPIFNTSFSNQGFLNLPSFSICGMTFNGKCETYDQSRTRVAKDAVKNYEEAKKSKKWGKKKVENIYTVRVLESICRSDLKDEAYKAIDRKFCKEDFVKFMASIEPKEDYSFPKTGSGGSSGGDNNIDEGSLLEKLPNFDKNTATTKAKRGTISRTPPLVVLHHTAMKADLVGPTRETIESPSFSGPNSPSVHFGVKNEPKVDYYMDVSAPGAHAIGRWNTAPYNAGGTNSQSLGVEIYYDPDKAKETPTDIQIEATAKLLALLEKKVGSGPDQLTFHSEIAPSDRGKEPYGLAHTNKYPQSNWNAPNEPPEAWFKMIKRVRELGAYKSGSFSSFDDDKLAKYIMRRSYQNAISILEADGGGGQRLAEYKKWVDANK